MSQPAPDTIVTQIVQLLAALDVTTISTHQVLRKAVLDLIERSAKDFRDEVVERIDGNERVRKKPKNYTKEEAQLLDHLDKTNCSVSASGQKVIKRLGTALRGLHSSLCVEDDEFKIPDGKQIGQSSNATFFVETTGCRQARIMQHYRMCEKKTHVNEGWRRLYRLWVVYEVDRLMSERAEPGQSEVADAVREFCRLSGDNEEVVSDIRNKSQSYVTAANRENGLGIILMLGSRTTDAWERGRILDDNAVSWLWASCVSEDNRFEDKAKALQRVACAVIRQGFLEYGIELDELLEEGHVFTRHFKAEAASRDSPAGLEVLAAAIYQVESSRPQSTSCIARDTQAQQQSGAWNEDPVATAVDRAERGSFVPGPHHQPHDSQAGTSGGGRATPRLNIDTLGVQSEGTATRQVPGSASYAAGPISSTTHGQSMQSPWQMHTDQGSPAIPGAFVGPHVPVAAAGQLQANDSELQTYSYHHHSTRDTQQNIIAKAAQSAITRAAFPALGLPPNTENAGDQQSVLPQWRPCAPRSGPHQGLAQPSPTGNALGGTNSSNAMLLESNETVYPTGAAHHLELPEQSYLGTSHGYGGASGNGSTWEEYSDDRFANLSGIWDVIFP